MTLKGEEYEPVPDKAMTSLRHFYDELVFRSSGIHFDFMDLTENLIRGHFELDESANVSKYTAAIDILPDLEAFERMSQLERVERFAVVPLVVIAPHVDETFSARNLSEWYTKTFTRIQTIFHRKHNSQNGCLEGIINSSDLPSCRSSLLCPLAFAAHALQDDAINPDFTSERYRVNDPLVAAQVAMTKLQLTEKLHIHSSQNVHSLSDNYWSKFISETGTNESTF